MRKITDKAINSFLEFKKFNESNTEVHIQDLPNDTIASLYLFGNKIAGHSKTTGQIYINNCGFFTSTTKERLNGLPNVNIQQKKGKWYLNGKEWDGKLIEIKSL